MVYLSNPIFLALIALFASFISSFCGLILYKNNKSQRYICAATLLLSGIAAVASGLTILLRPQIVQMSLGFNVLPFVSCLRLDALSGFFLLVVGLIVALVAFYIPFYLRS